MHKMPRPVKLLFKHVGWFKNHIPGEGSGVERRGSMWGKRETSQISKFINKDKFKDKIFFKNHKPQ